jgi:hypothetical protein
VLFDCIIAGSDTTASTIAALLFRLYQEPHCRGQVLEELERAGSLDALELDEVDEKLPYLQACVKETLRLYPPVPMVGRKSVAEVRPTSRHACNPTLSLAAWERVCHVSDSWKSLARDLGGHLPESAAVSIRACLPIRLAQVSNRHLPLSPV